MLYTGTHLERLWMQIFTSNYSVGNFIYLQTLKTYGKYLYSYKATKKKGSFTQWINICYLCPYFFSSILDIITTNVDPEILLQGSKYITSRWFTWNLKW